MRQTPGCAFPEKRCLGVGGGILPQKGIPVLMATDPKSDIQNGGRHILYCQLHPGPMVEREGKDWDGPKLIPFF